MAQLSLATPRVGNQHPRQNFQVGGIFGAVNAEIITDCDGCSSFAIDLRGTFVATIEVSGTIDGTNWMLIPILPIAQASRSYAAAASAAGAWEGKCSGFMKIRARAIAYTSGAAVVTLQAANGVLDDSYRQITPLIVTTLGALSAAATLTLPTPGAGLRQYLNKLRIDRFAGGLLIAAAAPIVITTSNLPGALAFSVPIEAAAQGTIATISEQFSAPIAASTQNGAVTISAPAVTNVIWRLTAFYSVAP